MSYDEDNERPARKRPSRKPPKSSGDSTVKVFLILFASLGGLMIVACCGVGAWGYFWFQKNLARAFVTNPADIQKITAEMTDITLPAEFVPLHGTAALGIKTVSYQWCPGGNCAAREDGLGMLLLTSVNLQDHRNPGRNVPSDDAEQFSDANLKTEWRDYQKTDHEFDIRGKKCKFFIIQGEQLDYDARDESVGDDDEDEAGVEVITIDAPGASPPTNPQPPAIPAGAGRKAVRVAGSFPGKEAEVSLELWLPPDDYNQEKILGMLRSIR